MLLNDRLPAALTGTCLTLMSVLVPVAILPAQDEFIPPGMMQGVAQTAAAAAGILIDADETAYEGGVATANGNVHIRYDGTEIFAGKAEYHSDSGDIFTEGGVSIYREGNSYKGEAAIYNVNTHKITANHLKSGSSPFFYVSSSMDTDMAAMDRISMNDGEFTTHDSVDPNYKIKAKSIEIKDPTDPVKGKVIFKNATIYAGDTPVLWLPYLAQTLDQDLGYHFIPGYRSNWGGYLLNRYGVLIGDHTLATYRLDFRSDRGVAGGVDLLSMRHAENPNIGNFKFYLAEDSDPQKTHNGRERVEPVDSTRYRVNLQHRIFVPGPDESTLYVDIDFNKISDAFFYEDFFEEEYRINPEPDNIINLTKVFPVGTLSILARADVNDFYRTDTRLPEISLDMNTHPLFNTGIYHTSQTSFGIYKEKLGSIERGRFQRDADRLETQLMDPTLAILDDPEFNVDDSQTAYDELRSMLDTDRGFSRYDSFHELSMPKTLFGWLNVNPKVGFRTTAYDNIESSDDSLNDQNRYAAYVGLDTSFKLSRDYPNIVMPKLGVDGFRHVVQPYLSYSYVNVNEDLDPRIRKIDRYAPTTRLRPIDMNQVIAVDEVRNWNVIRPGVFNRLHTKRDGEAYTWLEVNNYFEVYPDDLEFNRDFSNFFTDVRWRPLPWLAFDLESQFPVFGDDELSFTEVNTGLTFMPTDKLEFRLGDRLLQDHPFLEDSNLIEFSSYVKLTDRLAFGTQHRFEADDSTVESQQYMLYRDLNSWTMGLGAFVRDNRTNDDDFGVAFSLTLKDFPQFSLPIEFAPSGGSN